MPAFYISRQRHWMTGAQSVEIASGGLDAAGADMLGPRFQNLGEAYTFADPRAAVEAAQNVRKAWRTLLTCDGPVALTWGNALCEGEALTLRDARRHAREVYAKLPKCDGCNGIIGGAPWRANDWDGLAYCSDRCATLAMEWDAQANADADAVAQ
jgi:hypothetical protein